MTEGAPGRIELWAEEAGLDESSVDSGWKPRSMDSEVMVTRSSFFVRVLG